MCDSYHTHFVQLSAANQLCYSLVNGGAVKTELSGQEGMPRYGGKTDGGCDDTSHQPEPGRCTATLDVAEFPAGFGHNRALPSVTTARTRLVKMEG
jgi:hypothetical protein